MTYEAFETSLESSQPVELYLFTLGLETFRFTSAEDDIDIGVSSPFVGTYASIPISRSQVKQSSDGNRTDSIEIEMPALTDPALRYITSVPGKTMDVQLLRFHRSDAPDPEIIQAFSGVLQTVAFVNDGRLAIIQVQSLSKAKNRTIPRQTYQAPCNHMLYDSRCKISDTDPDFEKFLSVGAVDASGTLITATGAVAFGGDFFVSGFIEFENDFRTIRGQTGDVLEIFTPFVTSPLGQVIRCLAGCKLSLVDDCETKFDNVINYGGFAFVPTKNPFRSGIDPLLPSFP